LEKGISGRETTEDNIKRFYTENIVDLMRPKFNNDQQYHNESNMVEELPLLYSCTTITIRSLIKVKGTIDGKQRSSPLIVGLLAQ